MKTQLRSIRFLFERNGVDHGLKGDIFLVRIDTGKILPNVCLQYDPGSNILYTARLKKATEEDIFNSYDLKFMEKYNRGRPDRDKIKIRKKYEINSLYIGMPQGLQYQSVVLLNNIYRVRTEQIVRKISEIPEDVVLKCCDLYNQVQKIKRLKEQLGILKKKIQLAKINNEDYSDLEKQFEIIRTEIGYPEYVKRNKYPFLHYREVPNKGYIKIYRG